MRVKSKRTGYRKKFIASPCHDEEHYLLEQGYKLIAGIDEVGRGALAGPVVAAAVILPQPFIYPWRDKVRDSKQLSPKLREWLFPLIQQSALCSGTGFVSASEIDKIGILQATKKAMQEAIGNLSLAPNFLLIDALRLSDLSIPQKGIIHGDAICFSISCASIIAKVTRDNYMRHIANKYTHYNFAGNKGYGTPGHVQALNRFGPSVEHRKTFAPIRNTLSFSLNQRMF